MHLRLVPTHVINTGLVPMHVLILQILKIRSLYITITIYGCDTMYCGHLVPVAHPHSCGQGVQYFVCLLTDKSFD